MADLPTVFRTVFEERANQIALWFQAEGRMGHTQSYDFSVPGRLTVTCFESEGGRPLILVLTTKTSVDQVNRTLIKAIAAYDRGA